MIQLGKNLLDRYNSALRNNHVPANKHPYYTKWLRYYLDFSNKYGFNKHDENTVPCFIEKLQSKNQSGSQQEQARKAIRIYLELFEPCQSSYQVAQGYSSNIEAYAKETVLPYPVLENINL